MPRRNQLASAASAEAIGAQAASHERAARDGKAGSVSSDAAGDSLEFDDT